MTNSKYYFKYESLQKQGKYWLSVKIDLKAKIIAKCEKKLASPTNVLISQTTKHFV